MSVISREDAKRIIDNIDTFCAGWRDYAKEKIDNAPTIDHVKWIPVSERLPEEKKEVLVCDKDEFLYIGEYEVFADGVGRWSESVEYRFITDVTAWMPLPEPYKGEDGEEG